MTGRLRFASVKGALVAEKLADDSQVGLAVPFTLNSREASSGVADSKENAAEDGAAPDVIIATTHLKAGGRQWPIRLNQTKDFLSRIVARFGSATPLIFTGDLNDTPDTELIKSFCAGSLCAGLGKFGEPHCLFPDVAFAKEQWTLYMPWGCDQLDYLLYSSAAPINGHSKLVPLQVLKVPSRPALYLPQPSFPSDHVPIMATFGVDHK